MNEFISLIEKKWGENSSKMIKEIRDKTWPNDFEKRGTESGLASDVTIRYKVDSFAEELAKELKIEDSKKLDNLRTSSWAILVNYKIPIRREAPHGRTDSKAKNPSV